MQYPPGPPPGFSPPNPPGGHGPKPITGSAQTMAMHALTIDPRTGLPRGEQPPASTASVVAFVCGILLCLGPFTAIPAIIAGIVGRRLAKSRPDSVGGIKMSTTGIVLGCVNLLLSGVGALFLLISLLEG